jgi:undecaprenyl diphosphate synthase
MSIPYHVAVVMDGNGRWAKKRFLPRVAGHKIGVDALRRTVQSCIDRGISVLSVFAFSSENWNRPEEEVSGLMSILGMAVTREVPKLNAQGVQLHFPGDRSKLSLKVSEGLASAEAFTARNSRLILNVCFNYGGRWDISQAACQLQLKGLPVTEASLTQHLALAHVPDPDLFIRTGGEMRVSNFLLWQMAYSEFYFSEVLWPDFDLPELDKAISAYQGRERRFGRTSDQLPSAERLNQER